ncbi:Gfo/Idh/MocA family oxidoreductase [uncultured Thermanaerothrix sp.]|uniref:Gfo/Idh/MocA family protein n=1 Tax=uncultured Thermanaerothrix sp. TaxID=1195149 RepID=UPI002609EAE9|nr:Gfo/Idh/MocA family oxidoreductase [uncultured Thermanaerothrix sp.]
MPSQPVTAVLIGAGQRGAEAYAPYALQHPDQLRFVAVAEPDPQRRARFAAQHNIPHARQYSTWEDLLDEPQMADAALICTQDALHTAPALAALRAGYHILLEKPLAPRLEECEAIVTTSEALGRQLHVGHVMRYTRHYQLLREIVQSGVLGEVVDVDHRENVAFWHMVHSYVRGNWRNSALSSPMILAKCCHDLDMLPWVLGQRCQRLYSVGNLLHFRAENAPPGAPERCLDGCPAAQTCPYYAPYLYLEMKPFWHNYAETAPRGFARWATRQWVEHPWLVRLLSAVYPDLRQITDYRGWPLTVLALDPTPENLLAALRTGPYGRCVYHCDNDVVDHQVVSMLFSAGSTVTLTMHGHSHVEHRSTRIEGTRGRLLAMLGNGGGWIQVEEHRTLTRRTYDTSPPAGQGHGGGDMGLMAHFVTCVRAGGNPPEVRQTAREALESHRLAFAAEESRLTGRVFNFE